LATIRTTSTSSNTLDATVRSSLNSDPDLVRLFKGAEYLRCDSLMKLIAVVIACDIYFEDNTEAYERIKAKLGVTEEITFREDE